MDEDKLRASACLMTNDHAFSEPYASMCMKPYCDKTNHPDATTALYEITLSLCEESDAHLLNKDADKSYETFCKLMYALPKTNSGANPFEFVRSDLKHELLRRGLETSVEPDSWSEETSLRERVESASIAEKESEDASRVPTHAAVNVYVLACLSVARDRTTGAVEDLNTDQKLEEEISLRTRRYSKWLQCFGFVENVELVKASGLSEGGRRITLTKRQNLERRSWLFAPWFAFEGLRRTLDDRYGEKVPLVFVIDERMFEKVPDYENNRVCVLGRKMPLSAEKDRAEDLNAAKSKKQKSVVRRACRGLLDASFCMGCTLTYDGFRELLTNDAVSYKDASLEPVAIDGKTLIATKTKMQTNK